MNRLPDDVLHQVFQFSTFLELYKLGYPPRVVMARLGLRSPRNARWYFYRHRNRHVPFEYESVEVDSRVVHVKGRVYPSLTSSEGWVHHAHNCYSPWEYQTVFRHDAAPDMVPRYLCTLERPNLEISYRGRRNQPRPLVFQEGREVDVMDVYGVWWEGTMVECRNNLIRYHYKGWGSKWDLWYPRDSLHVAPFHSITRDWRASTLREGAKVEVGKYGRWYEGNILRVSTATVFVRDSTGQEMELERSSERLLFHGAHTGFHGSPFCISNVVWNDAEGTEVYQYRIRGGKTVLVDHVLSESETWVIMEPCCYC